MKSISSSTTFNLLSRCLSRLHQPSSKLQQCRFQSQTPNSAANPSVNSTFPRNANAALLALDDPSEAASEKSSYQTALRESQQRYHRGAKAREERGTNERRLKGMERLMARKWQGGDLYTPHDLTPREILKFSKKTNPSKDVFDVLGVNPLDAYKNPVFLAEFMTSGGKIKHPTETGLRPVNQRKLAKTIRRAIGMGLMPSCHVHPEMLRRFGPDQISSRYKWR